MDGKTTILVLLLLTTLACTPEPGMQNISSNSSLLSSILNFTSGQKQDDWKYDVAQIAYESSAGGYQGVAMQMATPSPRLMKESMGFSVGGAKDINNFRENIKNNYLPITTDLTYEGLYYDYYFDTGSAQECSELFCPSYSYAVSKDPISDKDDYYLSVGLNSNIKESDFKRKKLNLVIVMDISGSMSSSFDSYYYDQFGKRIEQKDKDSGKSKIEIAKESVVALLDHLNPDDRFGMVLFDDSAYLAKPLAVLGETDMERLKDHILEVKARGGTYMESGYEMAAAEFRDIPSSDEYENRIIFLTDAMPNIGMTGRADLMGLTKDSSQKKIYTTFIGIGVDFNTDLIDSMTKIRGANYYSVHSSSDFKKRMDDEFEYMVTPLVFDLRLDLQADGFEILKVYGSPEADEATGTIMKVNTLFPSKTEAGKTKGGIVLLKLRKLSDDANLKLKVSYEDRLGKKSSNEQSIDLSSKESYANDGIRKGILLSRYADLMKNWIQDERRGHQTPGPIPCLVTREMGIIIPPFFQLNEWERQSIPLHVSDEYRQVFQTFSPYFAKEMNQIGDTTLQKELDLLDKLDGEKADGWNYP